MSDQDPGIPRRIKPKRVAELPRGYRSTRRGSKSAKSAKRAEQMDAVSTVFDRFGKSARNIGFVLAMGLAGLLLAVIAFLILAYAINGVVRWNAQRIAAKAGTAAGLDEKAKENLLVIGVEGDEAVGFLAIRVDCKGKQVFGIAIPDGAFLEVPGQGFERAGESFKVGPEVSLSMVSNYLTVPFRSYLVVPAETYRTILKKQSVAGITDSATASDLNETEKAALAKILADMPQKNTALVPLPVKPIKLGDQTYFEPQRAQVADLLKSWWGVDASQAAKVTRVIVYNGAGAPGIAGEAAQQLIRNGFRVVDTKNADSFDYKTTKVVVQDGPLKRGQDIVRVLGVGTAMSKPSDQDVADVIVIIGKDYKPPTGASGGKQ